MVENLVVLDFVEEQKEVVVVLKFQVVAVADILLDNLYNLLGVVVPSF
jgi:hypothetical protein